jgi:hypothetical protein
LIAALEIVLIEPDIEVVAPENFSKTDGNEYIHAEWAQKNVEAPLPYTHVSRGFYLG